MANEQTKQTNFMTDEHTEQTTLKTVCSYVSYVINNICPSVPYVLNPIRSSVPYVKKNICPSVPYVKKNICSSVTYVSNHIRPSVPYVKKNICSSVPYVSNPICLVCLACLLFVCPVCSQSIHEFTPAEQQSISVPTPGLFDRSDAFSIDFTDVPKDEYSFPLPVGKAELVNNNSELEISTTKGDAVKAMFSGVVRLSKHNAPFGNVIVIRHDNGLETVYGYNAQNLVRVGDKVKAGQTIAIVGGEGLKTFCNFAIMVNGRRITPSIILEVNGHKLHQQTITFRRNGHRIEVKTHRVRDNMTDFKADPFANGNTIKWNLADMKSSQWSYPLPGAHVISPYGNNRGSHTHSGVDIKTKANDNVLAAFDGEVIESGYNGGYGNCIKIQHGNGLVTLYGHQSKNLVKVGQKVKAGQVIGLAGRTGRATTEHVHFEIFFCGRRYNPNILFNHDSHKLQNATLTIQKNGSVTSRKN